VLVAALRAILVWLVNMVASAMPDDPCSARLRAFLYYPLSFHFKGVPIIMGGGRINGFGLSVGRDVFINRACYFDLSAAITLGDAVVVGHHCVFVTAGHEVGPARRRAGARAAAPIVVEDGAWIGARATIMPGVRVGRGAVVGAGALVTRDVPADCIVAGVPAKMLRQID
jgi:maltose O-acetyltransferase